MWPGQEVPGSFREPSQGTEILLWLMGIRDSLSGVREGPRGGRHPGSQPRSAASSLSNGGTLLSFSASVSLPYPAKKIHGMFSVRKDLRS